MLLQDHDTVTLHDLASKKSEMGLPPDTLTISGWNVSWLVDPVTEAYKMKAAAIDAEMLKSRVLCLQETHWRECECRVFFQ